MSVLAISYPVTEGAKQAIDRYPAIGRAFCLPDSGRSEFEIVRLLSNTHYGHIHRFLEFIDKWLDVSGPIGRKALKLKHPFQLEQAAAELETFVHLYERLGTAVQAVEFAGNSVSPDVEVRLDAWTIRVEVYTPVDLMGFQLFERYVPMVLKYLDVSCGYRLNVKIQPVQEVPCYDQATLYYPYTIPEENETHKWLAKFAEGARQWLSKESPKQALRMPGPGGKVDIVVKIAKLDDDPGNRQICSIWATRSTDTKLFPLCALGLLVLGVIGVGLAIGAGFEGLFSRGPRFPLPKEMQRRGFRIFPRYVVRGYTDTIDGEDAPREMPQDEHS